LTTDAFAGLCKCLAGYHHIVLKQKERAKEEVREDNFLSKKSLLLVRFTPSFFSLYIELNCMKDKGQPVQEMNFPFSLLLTEEN
jgi:hypothetical protein